MEERIMPIVTIGETEYYKECDLLKRWEEPNAFNSNNRERMAKECFNYVSCICGHTLGYCFNSVPTFLRVQKLCDGQLSLFRPNALNTGSQCLRAEEDGSLPYDKQCPKVAWGITAFILRHSRENEYTGVVYRLNSEWTEIEELFSAYYLERKNIYNNVHREGYEMHAKHTDIITQLDEAFLADHKKEEDDCLQRTLSNVYVPDALRALFDNAVSVAKNYPVWLGAPFSTSADGTSESKDDSSTTFTPAQEKKLSKLENRLGVVRYESGCWRYVAERGNKAILAYFLHKMYQKMGKSCPWGEMESYFGIKNLSESFRNATTAKAKQPWRKKINEILY